MLTKGRPGWHFHQPLILNQKKKTIAMKIDNNGHEKGITMKKEEVRR